MSYRICCKFHFEIKRGSFVFKFLFFNRNDEEGGFVSLFLRNDNSIQMEVHSVHHQANYASYSIFQVMCQFTLGMKNSFKHHFSFNKINPNSGYGFPKMYSHEQINAKEVQFNNIQQLSDKHSPEGSGRRWCPRHQSNYNIQGKGGRNSKDCLLPSLRPLTVQCLL